MAKNPLKTYHAKRKFTKTTEPKGSVWTHSHKVPIFVIQEHDAHALHYDFRLEDEGVLKSWAIPKGPSSDPSDKRLAVQTEDHPLEYADFEGIIEEGNYGAGGVIIWDRGVFKNLKEQSLTTCIKDGHVAVWLEGKKMHGGYALIKTHLRGQNSWLFFKMKDSEVNIDKKLTDEGRSIVSGKTVKEVEKEHEKIHEGEFEKKLARKEKK